jgi:peptidoglycan/xylan/chitin deacetylase (PgdA/CDA1 family)
VPLIIGLAALCFLGKRKLVGIILFHRISENFAKSLSEISIKQFEEFCKMVSRSDKKMVHFSDYLMQSPNNICIAFDDGHKSVFDFAFTVMKKYNLIATVFVASGMVSDEKIDDF